MKKIAVLFTGILFSFINVSFALAASVNGQLFPGDDSNPAYYTPPTGYIHYVIPDSANEGTHVVTLDSNGAPDPGGQYKFVVEVGMHIGDSNTRALTWTSNFPVYAVIVRGEDAFYLYQYNNSVRYDTDLIAPANAAGRPTDVGHISIVFDPGDLSQVACDPTILIAGPLGIITIVLFSILFAFLLAIVVLLLLIYLRIRRFKWNGFEEGDKNIDIDVNIDKSKDIDIENNFENNIETNIETNIKNKIIINKEDDDDCRKRRGPCR